MVNHFLPSLFLLSSPPLPNLLNNNYSNGCIYWARTTCHGCAGCFMSGVSSSAPQEPPGLHFADAGSTPVSHKEASAKLQAWSVSLPPRPPSPLVPHSNISCWCVLSARGELGFGPDV